MSKVTVGDKYRNKETGEVTRIEQATHTMKKGDGTETVTEDFGLIELPVSDTERQEMADRHGYPVENDTTPKIRYQFVGWDKFLDKWERIEGTEVVG